MNLKAEVLVIAGWLADGEALDRNQGEMSLERLVARICADREMSLTVLSLVATALAKHIDAQDVVVNTEKDGSRPSKMPPYTTYSDSEYDPRN